MRKNAFKYLTILTFMFFFVLISNVSFHEIYTLPQNIVATYDEIKQVNISKKFGALISTSIERSSQNVSSGSEKEGTMVFKLFGLIPIRKLTVQLPPEEDFYIGGVPIGLSLIANGAIVVDEAEVEGKEGVVVTDKSEQFKKGDFIYEIAGQEINDLQDIICIMENCENEEIEVKFLRQNKEMKSVIKCVKDKNDKLKLGLLVKDDISGIGTLTYINTKDNSFGALGHAITDEKNFISSSSGNIYDCNLIGIEKGERNNPGQLRGVFLQSAGSKGVINKNTKFGIFGSMEDNKGLIDENLTARIGGRLSVTPGKASIISSVSGIREEYEIEIIKANYQSKAEEKSLVFRVTDKRLLELTGGIVQGMSGSPIMQNGKLVGAVTHVFMSDPTKGYGVYSDWMINN